MYIFIRHEGSKYRNSNTNTAKLLPKKQTSRPTKGEHYKREVI